MSDPLLTLVILSTVFAASCCVAGLVQYLIDRHRDLQSWSHPANARTFARRIRTRAAWVIR